MVNNANLNGSFHNVTMMV